MIADHSQCQIVRKLLIDNAFGVEPVNGAVWPIYFSSLPDGEASSPKVADEAICVYDTDGLKDGRIMASGEVVVHEGFQVKVRAKSGGYQAAQKKLKQIAQFLDTVLRVAITLDTTDYIIQNITRLSPASWAGKEPTSKRRDFFTITCTITIREAP